MLRTKLPAMVSFRLERYKQHVSDFPRDANKLSEEIDVA